MLQAAQAGRTSRLLYEQATTLERIARQQLILEDTALLDEYAQLRAGVPADDAPARGAAARARLAGNARKARAIARAACTSCSTAPRRARRTPATSSRTATRSSSTTRSRCSPRATQLTQRAIERLQETATQGREKWLYVGLATVGIAIALAIVFAMLIARPIRQLDHAIRQMGTRRLHACDQASPARRTCATSASGSSGCAAACHELEEQQTRFLRHVSHELKTPLTAVREGAELLRDNVGGELTPEQHDIVRIVRDNTLSLQKLIEDLLAYQQTRAMEPATLGPVALADVVRRVVREQKLAALARMVTFEATHAAGHR